MYIHLIVLAVLPFWLICSIPSHYSRLGLDTIDAALFCCQIFNGGLSDLLATARLTDVLPGHVVVFGIEPATLESGIGFSPEVEGSLEKLTGHVVDELRRLGYAVEECSEERPCQSRFWGEGDRE